MKKLVITFTIAIILFATQEQRAGQPVTVAAGASQNAAAEQAEKVPKTNTEQAEKITESIYNKPMEIESEVETKDKPEVQMPTKECNEKSEMQKATEPEETVECVDKGNQSLAEYKPQPSGQPNPFENAPPSEIVDQPVEALIGQGEDRPGEGKHF